MCKFCHAKISKPQKYFNYKQQLGFFHVSSNSSRLKVVKSLSVKRGRVQKSVFKLMTHFVILFVGVEERKGASKGQGREEEN